MKIKINLHLLFYMLVSNFAIQGADKSKDFGNFGNNVLAAQPQVPASHSEDNVGNDNLNNDDYICSLQSNSQINKCQNENSN
jgi:hypothetical protein